MHSDLIISSILLVGSCLLAPAEAQTTQQVTTPGMTVSAKPAISPAASRSMVEFRDVTLLESAPQPPQPLRHVAVQLSGRLIGQPPKASIEFVLTLQNNWSQDVNILDPLDSLSLQFSTVGKRLIGVPERPPKDLPQVGVPKDAPLTTKHAGPYPAPVQFRRVVHGNVANYEKEDVLRVPPGGKVQITFESEPLVMEKVMEALRTETGENAKLFRVKAFLALIDAPPQSGGRSLYSDAILLTIPSG